MTARLRLPPENRALVAARRASSRRQTTGIFRKRPVERGVPPATITFLLPVSTVLAIRTCARRSELPIGQVVTQAEPALPNTPHQRCR